MEIENIIKEMSLEEKAALLSGTQFWMTNPVPRLGIPGIYMTDGPCGLRKQGQNADHLGLNESEQTTSFPAGVNIASSWNTENARRMGEAIAKECHYYGVNMLLGPAVNIKRNPRCGRNFEYFSEDPYLSGRMGTEFVKGVQREGIGVSVKHFAANSNENYRFMGDSIVDERALREIYLKAFEMIVKDAKPFTVMCAYNMLNGTFCSENKYLLTDILRKEWGFDGVVLSDWGAVDNRVKSLEAGMDLEMPGDCVEFRKNIIDAAKNGTISMEDIDHAVQNILKLIERTDRVKKNVDLPIVSNSKLSGEIAADCAVLLKNDECLPLHKEEEFLVIGELFEKMRYQGAGSSLINPTKITTPRDAFDKRDIKYNYIRGYSEAEVNPDMMLEEEVVKAVARYNMVIFFGGQTDYTESEGYDRDNLLLPENQLSLIDKLVKLNKKIVFVLYGGSPVELPFVDKMNAILNLYLPGQSGGEATAALLFGEITPSGKLAETWPISYQEVPFGKDFISSRIELYKESVYVGYRYYDKIQSRGVRYPFGYGLSYTKFDYSDLSIKEEGDIYQISCIITNTGEYYGAEVVQLYIKKPISNVFRAEKELKAFTKIYLKPKESGKAVMELKRTDLSYYHVKAGKWLLENGTYTMAVGASSIDIRLEDKFLIDGEPEYETPYSKAELKEYYDVEQLPRVSDTTFEKLLGHPLPDQTIAVKKVNLNSKLTEYQKSLFGRIVYKSIVGVGERQYKRALKMPEGPKKQLEKKNGLFLMKLLPNNSIRSLSASSAGALPMNFAKALVEISNGHIIKGIQLLSKKEDVPPLPNNQVQYVKNTEKES